MNLHTLETLLETRLLRDVLVARYSALRLGGPADALVVADRDTDDLARIVQTAWDAAVPVRVMGAGSNVLVGDEGVRGLVVVNSTKGLAQQGASVHAASGEALPALARRLAARGLGGFTWAAGVPGTVGGAVVNNAGAHGRDTAADLQATDVLDAERGRMSLTNIDLAYDYRTSALKVAQHASPGRIVVLAAHFAFTPTAPEALRAELDAYTATRKRTQPPGASLGSIFKNPPGDYAGRLIEAAGLKGLRMGGAQVSEVHANFFVNTGQATACDYAALVREVQARVLAASGVRLAPEIEFVGDGFGPVPPVAPHPHRL